MITKQELVNGTNISLISDDERVKVDFLDELFINFVEQNIPTSFNKSIANLRKAMCVFDDWTLEELLTTELEDLYLTLLREAIKEQLDKAFPSWEMNVSLNDGATYTIAELPDVFAEAILKGTPKYLNILVSDDAKGELLCLGFSLSLWADEDKSDDSDPADKSEGEEEPETKSYRLELSIAYHRDYTAKNLNKRVSNRLAYKWPELTKREVYIESNGKGNAYTGYASIDVKGQDLKEVCEHVFFRLGKTSGKPWYRCKVTKIEQE